MENRRAHDRKYLTYFSRVVDRNTGRMLGYLVDLTTGGALLVGNIPLRVNEVFDVRIDLPDGFASQAQMEIQVKVVWVQPDIDPEFYRTGLQLVNVQPSDLLILGRMVSDYGA
jgi:hypothetical protein